MLLGDFRCFFENSGLNNLGSFQTRRERCFFFPPDASSFSVRFSFFFSYKTNNKIINKQDKTALLGFLGIISLKNGVCWVFCGVSPRFLGENRDRCRWSPLKSSMRIGR